MVTVDQLNVSLAGRYSIERQIGVGGMSVVYLAQDLRHLRSVALKMLLPELGALLGPERFLAEIRVTASLQHPNILPLFDSGDADGLLYYVMPYVAGESLRTRIDRETQMPVDEALHISRAVAGALDYAHRHGVIHRDLKPENILLHEGQALVADFGIALAISKTGGTRLTHTGITVGTPQYMSPEQASGSQKVDGRADVYALGAVLYEMLTGEPPFTGATAHAIIARQLVDAPRAIRTVRPSVPEFVDRAVQMALAKAPADRFPTPAAFATALSEPGPPSTIKRSLQGSRALVRSAWSTRLGRMSTLLVATVLVGVLISRRWSSEPPALSRGVAILYFTDASSDHSLGYLADGLTEALIDSLRKLGFARVISRDGVSRYRDVGIPRDSIARALNVGSLVQGRLDETGGSLRATVWTTDGVSGRNARPRTVQAASNDVLGLQQKLVSTVITILRELPRSPSDRGASWILVQRAEKLRKDGVSAAAAGDSSTAVVYFAQADSLLAQAESADPTWVNPIALRSTVALDRARSARSRLLREPWVDLGLAHAERALKLDLTSVDAREMRGRLRYERWMLTDEKERADALLKGAREDLMYVTRREPTRAPAWMALSSVHSQLHDRASSYLAATRAYEEDAYFSGVENILRQLYATSYDREEFATAMKWCNEGAKRFPRNWSFVSCKLVMRLTPAVASDADSAWSEVKLLEALVPEADRGRQVRRHRMYVAVTLAKSGLKDSARRVMESSRAGPDIDSLGQLLTAEALARTFLDTPADTLEAFRLLRAYVTRQQVHGFASTNHWWWRGLKADRRWREFVGGGTGR